jgi:uncharacterized protein
MIILKTYKLFESYSKLTPTEIGRELITAVDMNNVNGVKVFISKGADINIRTHLGWTPVILAAKGGKLDCLKLLIKAGADLNIICRQGWSALMYAAYEHHLDCVVELINAGADMTFKDVDDDTFIYHLETEQDTSYWMRTEKAQEFILSRAPSLITAFKKYGIKLCDNIKKKYDYLLSGSDLGLLGEHKKDKIVDDITLTSHLYIAITRGTIDRVESIIKQGVNLNRPFSNGDCPLILAIYRQSDKIAELIIKAGADLNFKDKNGNTPLIIAANNGENFISDLLIKYGADLYAKNDEGNTFMVYAYYYWLNQYSTQKLLIERDPDIIKEFKNRDIKIHPDIREEYSYIFIGKDLNLL